MRILKQLRPVVDGALRNIGVLPNLKLQRGENGITWIDDGKDRIAIINEDRAVRYRHGVKRRCRNLTRNRYLGGRQVKISTGDVILNIGANVGEISLYLADSGAQVYAFEPDPVVLPCLEANAANRSIEILPYGVWNADGPLDFFLATDSADSSAINHSEQSIRIDGITLDTIVKQKQLTRIRLIAGDAEGGEPEVLMGASEALKITDYVSLDCSFERRGEQTRDACTDLLESANFEILQAKSRKHILAARLPN